VRADNGALQQSDAVPTILSQKACLQYKASFDKKFPRYQLLDRELAEQTKLFEHLEAEYHAALQPGERAALARRITLAFEEKQDDMRRKTEEYRALHLELKRLKQAVSQYVERDHASYET